GPLRGGTWLAECGTRSRAWRRHRSRTRRGLKRRSAAVVDIESLFREHDFQLYRAVRRRFDSSVPDALIEDACASAWTIAWAQPEAELPRPTPHQRGSGGYT